MADRVNNQTAIAGVATVQQALSSATTGSKLNYVVPAGRTAMLRVAAVAVVTGGAPTIQVEAISNGIVVPLGNGTTPFYVTYSVPLNSGDTVRLNVTAAIAATTFTGFIGVEEFLAA